MYRIAKASSVGRLLLLPQLQPANTPAESWRVERRHRGHGSGLRWMLIIWQLTTECLRKPCYSDAQVTGSPNSQNQPPKANLSREETHRSWGAFSSILPMPTCSFYPEQQHVCSLPLAYTTTSRWQMANKDTAKLILLSKDDAILLL